MYGFASWFLFWTQGLERRDHQILSHNFCIAYPLMQNSCSGLFQFCVYVFTWSHVNHLLFHLVLAWAYLSICWSIALMQLSPVPMPWQCQLGGLLILSTSQYMGSPSVHLPNFNRNIIPWFCFICIAITFLNYLRFLKNHSLIKLQKTDVKKHPLLYVLCPVGHPDNCPSFICFALFSVLP